MTKPRWDVIAAGLLLTVACHHQTSGTPRRDLSCVRDKGCPQPIALPPCAADIATLDVSAVLSSPSSLIEGQTIAVKGPFRPHGNVCTELDCRPGCCNSCTSEPGIAAHDSDDWGARLHLLADPGSPAAELLPCEGDESGICCRITPGTTVVARGVLVKRTTAQGQVWALRNPEICAAGQETPK